MAGYQVDMYKKKDLKSIIESVIIAIGREENTQEFYAYLAKTIRDPETREFFEGISKKEELDIVETEAFLEELEEDLRMSKE